MKIKNIVVLDTSIATSNVGDEIIMDGVNKQLYSVFREHRFIKIPTHEVIYKIGMSMIRKSDYSFIGGSNILSSYMNKYKQWNIMLWQAFFIKEKITLMGVGWRDYQDTPNFYTKFLLKKVLSKKNIHSVRDSYTLKYLNSIGFSNVINTSCPTMWNLTSQHCKDIPLKKSHTVVFTLTDYNQDFINDAILIETLFNNYDQVYFWVQGKNDLNYLNEFSSRYVKKINLLGPNLATYDEFLKNNDCDYVGTRLHGGIRAIQFKKRSIIVGIDNRAMEKKKDFNVLVLDRKNINKLHSLINNDIETRILIPVDSITTWKNQFI